MMGSAPVASKLRSLRERRTDDAYLRECFGVDAANMLVRLSRPIAHFAAFDNPPIAQTEYNARFAGRPVGSADKTGRMRVRIDDRLIDARLVFAALGTTPRLRRTDPNGVEGMGDGPLAARIADAVRSEGLSLKALTVLTGARDPYRFDTASKRRDAEWFAEQWARLGAKHIRGARYRLIGKAVKPNGTPYTGAYKDWVWLGGASNAARWLGLVPFDDFDDRRAGEPVIYRAERNETSLAAGAGADFEAEPPTIEVTESEAGEISIFPTLDGMAAEQKFVIAIFGEKSSIDGEARPIAIEMSADLYLETGEQSITHAYHIAQRADADGRHLVVPVITDCDPSGYQMAISIARKMQALCDLKFPSLKVDVIHVGLTPDQVREFGLPESPLSDKDKRKARWKERMGVEQTEIDALLTLHPGALEQMIRDALAPYFDPTLAQRARDAERQWRAEAAIQDLIDDDPELAASLAEIEARAQAVSERIVTLKAETERIGEAADEINAEAASINAKIAEINEALGSLAAKIDLDPPDIPEADLPEQPTNGPSMVLSSAWDWVEATQRLKARKAYENDDSEEEAP